MSSLRRPQNPEPAASVGATEFLDMICGRPREERWQLVGGKPVLMMTPPTIIHQRISYNLAARLNGALDAARPDLFALLEIGLMIEERDDFRPVADLAVIDADPVQGSYASPFYLAVEVLSPSNSFEHVNAKKDFYASAPQCLHVLILGQEERSVEVWSRSGGWQGRVYRSAEDRIELPEFGFACALADLYRGTGVA